MHIPSALFTTDLFWSSLKWLMILGVWAIFAFGTWREDRKIKQTLQKPAGAADIMAMLRTLHQRDMRIWLQVSLLLIVMAANDIHRDAALLPTDFFTPLVPVMTPAAAILPEATDEQYDKVLKKNTSSSLPFSNITEFNEQNGKQEAYIDWLKERYESWLVTYYYLEKCKKTSGEDYEIIHRSLQKDLAGAHANEAAEGNILLAATGSYKEMYSEIPCDPGHLSATKSMYDANMQQARRVSFKNGPALEQTPAKVSGAADVKSR